MTEEKKGFKKTDVGLIPKDWKVYSIERLIEEGILDKPLDGNHGNIHPRKDDFQNHGIPFLLANNIRNGRIDTVNCKYISKKQADSLQKGFSLEGDVLLTHKGTVGEVALIQDIQTEYLMLSPQVTYYRVLDEERLSNNFLLRFFESDLFQKSIKNYSGGGTRAYIGISKQRKLTIILPPTLAEQRTIAEALSDVDELIRSLDGLIQKKQSIKKGTMQQLLSGKKRLPGFDGEWVVKKLGDLAENICSGKSNTKSNVGKYPIYGSTGIIGRSSSFDYRGHKILVARVGANAGTVNQVNGEYNVSDNTLMVNMKQSVNIDFVRYFLVEYDLGSLIFGSGQPLITGGQLKKLDIRIPDLEYQNKIVEILSDMDRELQTLRQKREKYVQIKQGMMQELLTGKTRLV